MKTIDYIYRFDPENPTSKVPPADAAVACRLLEEGNRVFSRWMHSCRNRHLSPDGEQPYVLRMNANEVGMIRGANDLPRQAPFALVLGCADARVPVELLFGQGFNDLFVIRVAGNVLTNEAEASVEFAIGALSESIRAAVLLGHAKCGAVTGAVDAYLEPSRLWLKQVPPALRGLLQPILLAVREAARGLEQAWGSEARLQPGYRDALIDVAVAVNTAHNAYDLRRKIELAGRTDIRVTYGVYDLASQQVRQPEDLVKDSAVDAVALAEAPTSPADFDRLAVRLAEQRRPRTGSLTDELLSRTAALSGIR